MFLRQGYDFMKYASMEIEIEKERILQSIDEWAKGQRNKRRNHK